MVKDIDFPCDLHLRSNIYSVHLFDIYDYEEKFPFNSNKSITSNMVSVADLSTLTFPYAQTEVPIIFLDKSIYVRMKGQK